MPVLNVDGLKLHAQTLGEGPSLVMVHGLLIGNLSSWFLAAGRLSGERRVVLYDLRGHGKSDVPESGYGLASLAADLEGLARQLVPDGRFDLAGYSYGALVALRFALARPERVQRLILVEAPLPPLRRLTERYGNADVSQLLASLPADVRKAALASPRRVASATLRVRKLVKETSLVADIEAEPEFEPAALQGLTCPTLCLYGEQSEFLDDARYLQRVLPDARLRLVKGSHLLLNENAAETASVIQEFLNG